MTELRGSQESREGLELDQDQGWDRMGVDQDWDGFRTETGIHLGL